MQHNLLRLTFTIRNSNLTLNSLEFKKNSTFGNWLFRVKEIQVLDGKIADVYLLHFHIFGENTKFVAKEIPTKNPNSFLQ